MSDFLEISQRLAPAFAYVGFGFLAKKYFSLNQKIASNFLFYVLIPFVVFRGAAFSGIGRFVSLALFSFGFGCACAVVAYAVASSRPKEVSRGMFMCMFSCFNIGWFGIPIVLALYGEEAAQVMTALYVGGTIYGNSIGYLLASDTPAKLSDVLMKLFRVPAIYGFLAALIFSTFLPELLSSLANSRPVASLFNIAAFLTSLIGMGLIGMSMVGANLRVGLPSVVRLLAVRMLVTTVLMSIFVGIAAWAVLASRTELIVFSMIPCLPIAANILVFSTREREDSSFVALTLFCSTVSSFFLLMALMLLQRNTT